MCFQSDVWTEDEERILIEAHEKMGNKWSQIAKLLPGRTENAIKNHWNAATRKKTMRLNRNRKHEPDNAMPKSTLLRDYMIKTMSSTTKKSTSSNATMGEFTAVTLNEPQPSSFSSDPDPIDLIPINDDEFSLMVQALEPQLQTNMNPQGFSGSGGDQHVLIDNSFDMHLNNNYQTATLSDAYMSCPVSEPAAFSNSGEPVYAYGDMNMDLAFSGQGGDFSSA